MSAGFRHETSWLPWFAWKPVRVGPKMVWLRTIQRRFVTWTSGKSYWEYRLGNPYMRALPQKRSTLKGKNLPKRGTQARVPIRGFVWNPLNAWPRNEKCYCRSGKKFKRCHLGKVPAVATPEDAAKLAELVTAVKLHGMPDLPPRPPEVNQ